MGVDMEVDMGVDIKEVIQFILTLIPKGVIKVYRVLHQLKQFNIQNVLNDF
jgi:hypothetical protein